MSDGWGGRRTGAGRKPDLAKEIRQKAIADAGGDAEYALGLIVSYMRDSLLPPLFRKACAELVMDRVWGRSVQPNMNDNRGEVTVRVVYGDDRPDDTPTKAARETGGNT